jgi:hypothetical protein
MMPAMSAEQDVHYQSRRLPLLEAVAAAQAVQVVWERWRGERPLPPRRAIDPLELREFLGRLYLVEVVREPFDLICRLDGTNIVFASWEDQTNRSLRDGTPSFVYERVFADVAEAAGETTPNLWLVDHGYDGHRFRYQRLVLPFGAEARVDWLLVYNHSLDHPKGWFPEIR